MEFVVALEIIALVGGLGCSVRMKMQTNGRSEKDLDRVMERCGQGDIPDPLPPEWIETYGSEQG